MPQDNKLDSPIQYLKGVGPKRSKILKNFGIETIEELFYYFPRRYEDRTNFVSISQLKENEYQTIKGEVFIKGERRSWRRRGFSIFQLMIRDKSGKITAVWFNQPYLKKLFKNGQSVILYGRVEEYEGALQMNSPEFEVLDEKDKEAESLSLGRMVPIYPLSEGITQRYFRKLVKQTLDKFISKIEEPLPYDIRKRQDLLNLAQSLINIHFPQDKEIQQKAYQRLAFEEFFFYSLPVALRKLQAKQKQGIAHKIKEDSLSEFINSLNFELTSAQERVLAEIKNDMRSSKPMQRLLQGDVGSGKTVVATIAAIIASFGGWQAAFMVPTEILANQHFENIQKQIKGLSKKINLALLTSSLEDKEKQKIYKEIREGRIDLIIGTHALIQEELKFKKLGLVVIDEQHKFGVSQRALLPKKGTNPDVLIMTATPIPRTLSMTIYGDLDISVIDELPKGRIPIETKVYPEEKLGKVYDFIKERIKEGRQAYIVYPLIEESDFLELKAAQKMFAELRKGAFKDYRLGMVHGRMKRQEQDMAMIDFKNGKLDILVATTVLEVGIDVANASVMVIEHAERFGLAQLHQLRGRIGRGKYQSYCILIANPKGPDAIARINAISSMSDGFLIAEEDLKIRGPGEFFGQRQHGLSELKIANPITQLNILQKARDEAIKLIEQDPALSSRTNLVIREKLNKTFPEFQDLMLIG
ncbi:MAG TPA: ATP-dependent DNA helicase RecG [Candidatus Omnitrophota bacterium]|nr:ATP-dependent DNA helicase RecG [Candidatus Omnitrophota bacterium]